MLHSIVRLISALGARAGPWAWAGASCWAWARPAFYKIGYAPQPKPSAEAPPPRVCHSVREVPELPDVPDLHRRPPFGGAQ